MSRRTSRKHAFIIVYQMPFQLHPEAGEAAFNEMAEDYLTGVSSLNQDDRDFAVAEARGVRDHLEAIDGMIAQRAAEGWSLGRLNKIDLAALRLAVFELAYAPDIPTGVSINEAVELCKEYGDDASPAFVNGVLASVAKSLGEENGGRE